MLARPWMVGIAALLGAFAAARAGSRAEDSNSAAKSPTSRYRNAACNPEISLDVSDPAFLNSPGCAAEWIGWMTTPEPAVARLAAPHPGGAATSVRACEFPAAYGWLRPASRTLPATASSWATGRSGSAS